MLIKPSIRGIDTYGSGAYGAPRGNHLHRGIDLSAYAGSQVYSITSGRVSKIGYPYSLEDERKAHFRYVEIQPDNGSGLFFRYFYLSPIIAVGDKVSQITVLGIVQDLTLVYPGITNHVHFEIKNQLGAFLNPGRFVDKKA